MTPLLQLEGITAGYGGKSVVREISLGVGQGEFCALLGLNGSGKTTLLKAVCGLLPMESGRCLVEGLDCTQFHERRRAQLLSYIPQRHSKMRGVTVLDAVLMGLNPHLGVLGSPGAAGRQRARETLARMELADLAERDFSRLSEGQKQMVVLARALVQNVPVMLMDEPDSALDFLNRHRMLQRIRELIHGEGKAGLVTLHDPNFALAYCDRIFLLREGAVAGELAVAGAGREEVRRCLEDLYGQVEVLEHGGKWIMVQGGAP